MLVHQRVWGQAEHIGISPAASDDVEEREGASTIGLIALKLGIIKQ